MDWLALKTSLFEAGHLPLIFKESVENKIQEILTRSTKPILYEPLLFDDYINEAPVLLDKVLAFRREFRELEIASVKEAVEYQLFLKQAPLNEAIELSSLRAKGKTVLADAHAKASVAFGNLTPEANGFSSISAGVAESISNDLDDIKKDIEKITQRWQIEREYQYAYHLRREEPGNAHNYGERAKFLEAILLQDIVEARDKLSALKSGIEQSTGLKLDELPIAEIAVEHVDELVMWLRKTLIAYRLQTQQEYEYDVIVPLTQLQATSSEPIVSTAMFNEALKKTVDGITSFKLNFELQQKLFKTQKPRIVSIGLAYGNPLTITSSGLDRNATADSYARLSATIVTPMQSRGTLSYRRPPVVLGAVSVYGGSTTVARSSGNECRNINPIGEWSIHISPRPVFKSHLDYTLAEGTESPAMTDLKLHLRVREIWHDLTD